MKYLFGIHAVEGVLLHNPARIKKLFIDANRQDGKFKEIINICEKENLNFSIVDKKQIQLLVGDVLHQGVIAECFPRKLLNESDLKNLIENLKKPFFFLILDGIQDPHNLGACLRSADAAGVNAVIAPKDNSTTITAVTEKVACGAAESVPFIQVTNLARTIRELKEKGVWCYGLSDKASNSLYQSDLKGDIAFVLGAEGKGIRNNIMKQCDMLYSIPMQGMVSSLNVSVATGICLYESVRQRSS